MDEDCQQLRRVAEKILELRKAGSSSETIRDATSQGLVLVLQLKDSNKSLSMHTEELRASTSDKKNEIDQSNLQLQNLQYEKQYYEREIRACNSFASAFSDEQIGLMSVQDFMKCAPRELTEGIENDEHKLMLNRLAHELQLRKELVSQLEQLNGTKASLMRNVAEQRATLANLPTQLQSLENASKQLRSVMGANVPIRGIAKAADLLPLPLYIIYTNAIAAKEALELSLDAAILGSVLDAEQWAKKESLLQNGPVGKEASANSSEVHPLAVGIDVWENGKPTGRPFVFYWHPSSKVVTGMSDDAKDARIMASLFPYDDGNVATGGNGALTQLNLARYGKPFRWAQQLAASDILPVLPNSMRGPADWDAALQQAELYRHQQRIVTFLERVKSLREGEVTLK